MVPHVVPAEEVPIWQQEFAARPPGFEGMDRIMSKHAYQVCSSLAKMRPDRTWVDFMFRSRIETLDLTKEEYDQLDPDEQREYTKRQVNQMKRVLH